MTKDKFPRPKVFIGSSVEGLDVAYAVQENLEHDAEVTVWSQGVFEPAQTTLETLEKELGTFDFALFVFTPDDVVRIRGHQLGAVRDNVLFELGLAIGKLGRERAFILMPREEKPTRLPTDLLGVTPATYNPNRTDENFLAALGPACNQLKRTIKRLGLAARRSQSNAAAETVASGLSTELKQQLTTMLIEQNARVEGAFKTFETNFRGFLDTQQRVDQAMDPLDSLQRLAKEMLSQDARVLLKLIAGHHLTFDQYDGLLSTSISHALEQLRDVGFLIPMEGYDKRGKEVPVYWFPPGLAALLRDFASNLQFSASTIKRVADKLSAVGYQIKSVDKKPSQ